MKKFLIFFVLLIFCIGFVSASDNSTDQQDDVVKIYVNSSKVDSGDGSSWDKAFNGSSSWNDVHYGDNGVKIDNCVVYLADGEYSQDNSITYNNCTFIGQGKGTVISFYADNNHVVYNSKCRFINITFVKKVNLADNSVYVATLCANYDFVNCTFVDLPVVNVGWPGSTKVNFYDCLFTNVNQTNLIVNKYYANLYFDRCVFDNISANAIVYDEDCSCSVIDNCIFRNCHVKGILRTDSGFLYGSGIKNASYDSGMICKAPVSSPYYFNSTDNLKVYVNSSCAVSGDGSSWENALKSLVIYDGLTVYLSEGSYGIPNSALNITYVGLGDKTVIDSFNLGDYGYSVHNNMVNVVNVTFLLSQMSMSICNPNFTSDDDMYIDFYYNIKVDGMNFHFSGCDFVNSTFVSRVYNKNTPDKDGRSQVCSIYFDDCRFRDFNGSYLIYNWEYSKFVFDNCSFVNISGDAIVDSYGGQIGTNGLADGVYINNSKFYDCNVGGVVKARNLGNCEIKKCNYDFDASNEVGLVSPFYVNKTDIHLNDTKLNVTLINNTVIVTLIDIDANKPLSGVEVSIINNDRIFAYKDTDVNGQIILSNLSGVYNFEFFYPGDEYVGFAPSSLNQSFIFGSDDLQNENESITNQSADKTTLVEQSVVKVSKKAAKITAKKTTFKKSLKTKKYTVTLKSTNTPLKNIKLTLKIGKKTYKATTNSKGKATFKITKLFKKAKYSVVIKFAGNNNYFASTKNVKIIVK